MNKETFLEEYAQHIDMKMLKGLSEEEAIRDFGPVQELAAGNGIKRGFHLLTENCRKFFDRVKTFFQTGFSKSKGEDALEKKRQKEEKRMKEHGMTAEDSWGKRALAATGRGFKTMMQGLLLLGKWCLILLWNGFWLCMSILCGLFALTALFGAGAFVILMLQGYPLVGVVMVIFGILLCAGVLSFWCFSLINPADEEKLEAQNW